MEALFAELEAALQCGCDSMIRLVVYSLLLTFGPTASWAHNGWMAVAQPVEGIAVDGDLSDWPEGLETYALTQPEAGDPPRDQVDFQGHFRVGYNRAEKAVYVAVEVRDEAVVREYAGGWNTQDGSEVYLYALHQTQAQELVQHVVHGDRPRLGPGVEVAQGWMGGGRQYEWRLDIAALGGGDLAPGLVLGLDVVASDWDPDGSFSWMAWGRQTSKSERVERVGDVLLVAAGEELGRLSGRVTTPEGAPYAGLIIQAYREGLPAGNGLSDEAGRYSALLPAGVYRLAPALGQAIHPGGEQEVRVERGAEVRADLTVRPRPLQGRLSFWVDPGHGQGLATAYARQLAPLLKGHGLEEIEVATAGRVDSVFSRFFKLRSQWQLDQVRRVLQADSTVTRLRRQWAGRFGGAGDDGLVRMLWEAHQVPAGTGRVEEAGAGVQGAGPGLTRPAGPGNRQGLWHSFDVSDGLPHPHLVGVLQDRAGRLWIATNGGGVTVYDGIDFTTFSEADGLASDQVRCLLEDSRGRLWFGTNGGLSRLDQWRDGRAVFTTFREADGMSDRRVRRMLEDGQGRLWLGTDRGGLIRFDGATFTAFRERDGLVNDRVRALALDGRGRLWLGTDGRRLSIFDGETFTMLGPQDGLPDMDIEAMIVDRAGQPWVGTQGGVSRWDGAGFASLTGADGLASTNVETIYQDGAGRMWLGGYQWRDASGGLSRWDGAHMLNFRVADGLISDDVGDVMVDREGHLWAATYGGLSRWDGGTFTTFTARDGLPAGQLGKIVEDRQGRLWMTSGVGVVRYDSTGFENFTVDDGLVSNNIVDLFEDRDGRMWIGSYESGVSRWEGDGAPFVNFTMAEGLSTNWVFSIGQDRAGHMWFANWNNGRVNRWDGTSFSQLGRGDGLPSDRVRRVLVADQDGGLWIATDAGLCRWEEATGCRVWTAADGLADDEVHNMLEDSGGHMWFATDQGVSRWDGSAFTTFTAADGLGHDQVRTMLEDQRGHLWFATRGGVSRWDGQIFQNLNRRDGLPSNVVNGLHQTADGAVWITTQQGLVRYRSRSAPPSIRIVGVIADRRYGTVAELELEQGEGPVEFEFRGGSFKTRPGQMVYRYRLQGLEEGWRQTRQTRVRYDDLPQGDYVFEVQAVDRDLDYSEEAARVALHIRRSYGAIALWGGLGLALAVAVGALGYAGRRRLELRRAREALIEEKQQRLEEQQAALREREQAQDMLIRSESMAAIGTLVAGAAHELNNPIGAASSLMQTTEEILAEDEPEDIVAEREAMVDDLRFARKELGRAKEIVASLLGLSRQSQDYTEEIDLNEVVRDALRVLYNQYKQYEVNIAEDYAEGLPVIQGNFAQLGQVALNLVQNAVEAIGQGEGRIYLRTWLDSGEVVFECRDSGPGMPEDVRQDVFKPFFTTKAPGEGTGLGLYVCHQIVAKHGGHIEVESQPGQGTVFRVLLPLAGADGIEGAEQKA